MKTVSTCDNPDPVAAPRARLVAAAIRLLEEGGPESLQARRVAGEVGASTMAVYTYFGGMGQLVAAVAREGFARFARALAAVPETADPLADLFALAMAYREYALANPQLYRMMHGLTAPGGQQLPPLEIDEVMTSHRYPEGREAFGCVHRAVVRVLEAGDGTGEDPVQATSQLWSTAHGYVLLEIAGYFGSAGRGLRAVMLPLAVKVFSGLGHSQEAVRRSAQRVLAHGGMPA
jgi:AcrR family transcriptional regulator